jgi:hypothetical protein
LNGNAHFARLALGCDLWRDPQWGLPIIFGVAGETNPRKGEGIHTKSLNVIVISVFLIFAVHGNSAAGGLFGPPERISREAGGLHTGIRLRLPKLNLKITGIFRHFGGKGVLSF